MIIVDPENDVPIAIGVFATKDGIAFSDGSSIPWDRIDAARNRIRFAKSVLVTIAFSYGRASDFKEQFITDLEDWKAMKAEMMGRDISFGEIAGKHSDVTLKFSEGAITEDTDVQNIINFHQRSGYRSGNVWVRETYEECLRDGHYQS